MGKLRKKVSGNSGGLVKRHGVEQRTNSLLRRNLMLEDRITRDIFRSSGTPDER